MKKLLCKLIGHKTRCRHTDEYGYKICLRCGSHPVYDYETDSTWALGGWLMRPVYLIRSFWQRVYSGYIDKNELPF